MSVMKLEIFQVCAIPWHPHEKKDEGCSFQLTQYRYRNKELYVVFSSALGRYVNVCIEYEHLFLVLNWQPLQSSSPSWRIMLRK